MKNFDISQYTTNITNSIGKNSVLSIGVDILDKTRIVKICNTLDKTIKFASRILSADEIAFITSNSKFITFNLDFIEYKASAEYRHLCNQALQNKTWNYDSKIKITNLINYLAKRFCAKEAISKSLKCGISAAFSFKDVSILNHKDGSPIVIFNKTIIYKKIKIHSNKNKVLISISDEKNHCIAFCIIN